MRILVCAVAIAVAVGIPAPARAQAGSAGIKGGLNGAGPQLTFISKVTQSTAEGETDISDTIAGVDAGLTFGIGFEMAAGRGSFGIDGRVNLGLKNLSEAGTPSLKSRAFLLLAGYRF